jgi:coproporphyrinogen III oxidase-like Fe-S oxidoreductase
VFATKNGEAASATAAIGDVLELRLAPAEAQREVLGQSELFRERLMLGLRFVGGLDVERLALAFQEASRQETLGKLESEGLGLQMPDGRFRLTPRGLLLHSDVCARLL